MNLNLLLTVCKALVKGKLGIGQLTGLERFLLSQFALPDRIPTLLVATNIEPYEIDEKYDYSITTSSVEANLELFDKVRQRFQADIIVVPCWMGLLTVGAAELGTRFKIEERRVPYPVSYPIRRREELDALALPTEPAGYLKMYFDINKEAQRRYPDTLIYPVFDGPWDLAMLLRGDRHFPMDFRLHKDYVESTDSEKRAKIRKVGDPDLYPAIMEFTTQAAVRHIQLAKEHGLDLLGATLVDQYATKPILSLEDFVDGVGMHAPDCLGMSALLTTTMMGMGEVIEALREAGLRERVKVIVGGAPVSRRFAESVGADGYASDAASGVKEIRALIAGGG